MLRTAHGFHEYGNGNLGNRYSFCSLAIYLPEGSLEKVPDINDDCIQFSNFIHKTAFIHKLTSEPKRYTAYTREYLGCGVFALMLQ
jgi:hypothetical protein